MVNNLIAQEGASYIRDLTVHVYASRAIAFKQTLFEWGQELGNPLILSGPYFQRDIGHVLRILMGNDHHVLLISQ